MSAFLWATVATLAATLAVCFWLLALMERNARESDATIKSLFDKQNKDAELIAGLEHEVEMLQVGESNLEAQRTRLTDELAQTKKQGEKAAIAGMSILAREQSGFAEERSVYVSRIGRQEDALLAICQFVLSGALGEGLPRRALPPRRPPLALPSGNVLVEHRRVILPADDEDAGFTYWASEPLPAGTNGTGAA